MTIYCKYRSDRKWLEIRARLEDAVHLTYREKQILENELSNREHEIREGDHEVFLELCRRYKAKCARAEALEVEED